MGVMTRTLTLYSTAACHLCELAEALLRSMPELARCTVSVVDVADDPLLFGRYGVHIPVLAADGRELSWPFNADDVIALL